MNSRRCMAFLPREGHFRRLEEYQITALALCLWSQAADVRNGSLGDIEGPSPDVRFGSKAERLGFKPTEEHHKEIAAIRHEVQEWIANQFDGLVFVKTHNGLVLDHGRSVINFAVTSGAIYIIRNPLDVAISLSHHMNRTIDGAIEVMGARDNTTLVSDKRVHEIWGSWSQHVESWTRKPHHAIYIMRYEDMLNVPKKIFGALARHLLLDPTPAQLDLAIERSSFDELQSQEEETGFQEKPERAERFFREGRAGQWKDFLSTKQIERIVNDHGEQMRRFGYLPLA